MPKQLEVTLRARNNLLIQARVEMGYVTQAAAGRAIGIGGVALNTYECFRTPPTDKRGGWRPTALRIAQFYGMDPGALWPEVLRKLEEPVLVCYSDVKELAPGLQPLALPASTQADDRELRAVIDHQIAELLPKRDAQVIRLYFGLDGEPMSLRKISAMFGVTVTRGAQLLNRSLKRLREKAPHLEEWIDDRYGEREDQTDEAVILT